MQKIIYTDDAPKPIGPYSQAVFVNSMLFCSGQIAADCLDADITEQTMSICKNIAAVLKAAGMDIKNVVKTTCFLTDMADFEAFNAVYETVFTHKPARSCVAAAALPKGALAEIEVIAAGGLS